MRPGAGGMRSPDPVQQPNLPGRRHQLGFESSEHIHTEERRDAVLPGILQVSSFVSLLPLFSMLISGCW